MRQLGDDIAVGSFKGISTQMQHIGLFIRDRKSKIDIKDRRFWIHKYLKPFFV